MKLLKKQKGFTLIELLIVVAIISILSTLLMVNFIAVRQRGRDTQRKSDLRQIQSALELYRADGDAYPASVNNTVGNCGGGVSIGSSSCSTIYMKKIPKDPNGTTYYNSGNYYYSLDSDSTYTLAACIENKTDQDSNVCQGQGCPAEVLSNSCTSGFYYVLANP